MRKNTCQKRNDLFCWFLIWEEKTVHSIFAPVVCAMGCECFLTRYCSKSAMKLKEMNTAAKMLRYEPSRQWKVRILFLLLSVNYRNNSKRMSFPFGSCLNLCVSGRGHGVCHEFWMEVFFFYFWHTIGRHSRTHVPWPTTKCQTTIQRDVPVHRIQWAEFRLEKNNLDIFNLVEARAPANDQQRRCEFTLLFLTRRAPSIWSVCARACIFKLSLTSTKLCKRKCPQRTNNRKTPKRLREREKETKKQNEDEYEHHLAECVFKSNKEKEAEILNPKTSIEDTTRMFFFLTE